MSFTRRSGVDPYRRGGQRGGGGASDIILNLNAGTFTRASAATYQTSASTLASATTNVRRWANHGGGVAGLLLEGASTNRITTASPMRLNAAGWSTGGGTAPTISAGTGLDPFGAVCDQVVFPAVANSYVEAAFTGAAATKYTLTAWAEAAATQGLRLCVYDNVSGAANISADKTVATAHGRHSYTATTGAGAATFAVRIYNASDAAARTVTITGVQIEPRAFPTSLITTAGGVRAMDDLRFASAPLTLRAGPFDMVIHPLHSSANQPAILQLLHWSADDRLQVSNAQQLIARASADNATASAATWSALQKMTCRVDVSARSVELVGATTGGAEGTSTGDVWPDTTLYVGTFAGGVVQPFYGLMRSPTRVAA